MVSDQGWLLTEKTRCLGKSELDEFDRLHRAYLDAVSAVVAEDLVDHKGVSVTGDTFIRADPNAVSAACAQCGVDYALCSGGPCFAAFAAGYAFQLLGIQFRCFLLGCFLFFAHGFNSLKIVFNVMRHGRRA